MSDDPRSIPSDPTDPSAAPTTLVTGPTRFSGRTQRKSQAIRAGVVVGTGLVVALGAAVAMGASPAPTSQAGASRAPAASASTNDNESSRKGGLGFGQGGPAGDFGRGGPGHGSGFGKVSVTAVSGSSVSLATDDGWTRTITTTSATTVTRGGEAATLGDISVGDEIRFRQTRNADGTFTISAINIVLPSAAGTVTAVGSETITITLRDGTSTTILTTASTKYRLGKADGTRADVTVGIKIGAIGEQAVDGSLTAKTVAIRLPHVQGTVAATSANTITISRRDGTTVTIHVAAGTSFRVAGIGTATLADVKAGMLVAAAGTQRADGSIDATEVHAGQLGKGRGRDETKSDGFAPDAPAAPDASAGTGG